MTRLEPPFDPKIPPKIVYVGPLFGVLSQEIRHTSFFLGAQMGGRFLGGHKKLMLKSLCAFSAP